MAAPELEWADIDKALAKNRQPQMSVIWGRRIAAAAAVALLVIGGAKVLLLPGGDDERGLVADNTEAPRQNLGERWLETQGGYFEFGGSTIIVLLKGEGIELNEKLLARKNAEGEIPVKVGEWVAVKR